MSLFCNIEELLTESDVEQKFIYKFLSADSPIGLNFDDSQILTKHMLRQKFIGKGNTSKYYYPDYIVILRGIPVLVVEAKKPNENLEMAYSEARLYANEINANYPHNISVCQYVIVCNGNETWAGYSDHIDPEMKISFDDFSTENSSYINLLEFCSKNKLEKDINELYGKIRNKAKFYTPVSNLGGKRAQNEELEENSFGRTLVFENRKIFDPETEEDRYVIVENAYITTSEREQHIDPIYKEIRKFELPFDKNAISLATDKPTDLIEKLSLRINNKKIAYSLLLIIGNVGSGKTTFVRYFQKHFLEKTNSELSKKCEWVFLNMNYAPLNNVEIYNWLKNEIIEQIKCSRENINFHNYETIKSIFKKEINKFEEGIGSLLKNNENKYYEELYNELNKCLNDKSLLLRSLISYLKEYYSIIPIIVLDNCDKKTRMNNY